MQGTIKAMDRSGHSTVEYDTEVAESVEVALEHLRRQLGGSAMLFDGTTHERIAGPRASVDKGILEREEIVVVPPMAGGCR